MWAEKPSVFVVVVAVFSTRLFDQTAIAPIPLQYLDTTYLHKDFFFLYFLKRPVLS